MDPIYDYTNLRSDWRAQRVPFGNLSACPHAMIDDPHWVKQPLNLRPTPSSTLSVACNWIKAAPSWLKFQCNIQFFSLSLSASLFFLYNVVNMQRAADMSLARSGTCSIKQPGRPWLRSGLYHGIPERLSAALQSMCCAPNCQRKNCDRSKPTINDQRQEPQHRKWWQQNTEGHRKKR